LIAFFLIVGSAFSLAPGASLGAEPSAGVLTVVERSIVQDQGSWQVDYQLRHEGPTFAVATAADIHAKVVGWVSNSRVASHAVPRLSTLTVVAGPAGLSGLADVIASDDEAQRCRERAIVQVWPPDAPEDAPLVVTTVPSEPSRDAASSRSSSASDSASASTERPPLLSLAPGTLVRVRLRLEHQHVIYGDYDPLLSQRTVELHLGGTVLRDVVPMDREQYLALPRTGWPAPPQERRDPRHFISAPDSLHLEAHVPGNGYYRFPERPVRYATRMRLKFWYLVATGTEGQCRARIAQYKDTPTAWKVLSEGAHEECLTQVGRWVRVERIIRTEPDATTLALDFRICDPNNTNIGEMWIDDVSLEPVAAGPAGP
jgi:hypothetical protein